ncbi:cation:proton antiporter [Sanguibacter antarcticus]|uniref:Sodium/proton antiporter (CPA1 family) n=1 Tax=Sanguibacter antarcticus TaxID=372484 RepID=A0A2A9E4S1_9MICO|nr:cation:proton antiporter [Sanguibacter antarcticus]PFG33190.1 sodium/proton antiporter (CPA1 family) [Sanguibacter antarcticus]
MSLEADGGGLLFLAVGLATLAAALLPRILGRVPVSVPMVFLAAGMVGFALLPQLPNPDPLVHDDLALHLTEVCVILSLMGAGLALNRPVGWRRWSTTWRLLGITMPLSMLAVGLLGWAALGVGAASAVLLAAVLAPTDPVLATEVQVSEPVARPDAVDDEARFALTSEAGLNDGLAFPFTYAAIGIAVAGVAPDGWLGHWLLVDVVWRLGVGVLGGLAVGWLFGKLFFSTVSERLRLTESAEGFVALAATFLAYGATELAEGYGFVAVFVCACSIRAAERAHGYHAVLHSFVEQIERLLTVVVLVLLGGAVSRGLLSGIGWREVGVAAAVILVVRPVAGWIGLSRGKTGPRERGVIAFFGVRGVGSLYYVAYALHSAPFPDARDLWAIVGLVVVGSIVVHGALATPAMAALDARRARRAPTSDDGSVERTPV